MNTYSYIYPGDKISSRFLRLVDYCAANFYPNTNWDRSSWVEIWDHEKNETIVVPPDIAFSAMVLALKQSKYQHPVGIIHAYCDDYEHEGEPAYRDYRYNPDNGRVEAVPDGNHSCLSVRGERKLA